jgi:HAD superfamily hydrolase (TIGR01484 family)
MSDGMQPIEEMSVAEARAIEGVVFDVDDTLTSDGVVEEAAYRALFRLRDAGLRRIAVTGRPLGWVEPLVQLWPIDLGIGENGAGWLWREGRIAREAFFDAGDGAEVLARVRARVRRELPEVREATDGRLRRRDLAFDVGETVRLPRATVDALVAAIEGCGARAVVSSVHAHAATGAWDKAEGVARAASEVLGIERERLRERFLFVGDSGNDAAAFAFFPRSAGVANVREHLDRLPVAPRWIARQERGRGFAEIVETLIARRGVLGAEGTDG